MENVEDRVLGQLRAFSEARNWSQFHTPAHLASGIAIETGELLECFQWGKEDLNEARLELADVLTYAYLLADKLGESPASLIAEKLEISEQKYPGEKSYGRSDKYDQLH